MAVRPPLAWQPLLGLAGVQLLLCAWANGPAAYGLMTDELYYLDCADRLDWRYVDHPPLSIALLWLSRSLLGDSVMAVRALAMLATGGLLVLAGVLARELGGGPRAITRRRGSVAPIAAPGPASAAIVRREFVRP